MKNTLKKVLFSLGAVALLGAGSLGLVNAQTDTQSGMPKQTEDTNLALGGHSLITEAGSYRLLTNAIKFVNWTMSILSVVALVVLLIGGYRMITANGDDGKYKKGLTVLKQAAIGLIIIGLSWAIIRLIFRFISKTGGTDEANYNTNGA